MSTIAQKIADHVADETGARTGICFGDKARARFASLSDAELQPILEALAAADRALTEARPYLPTHGSWAESGIDLPHDWARHAL